MRRRHLLSVAGAVAAAVAGCSDAPADTDDDADDDEPPARVVESQLRREHEGTDEETVTVEGVVERTRDVEIMYLEVRVEFYAEGGELLDSTIEHLSDVTEGDRWPFSVTFPGVGEAAAQVVDHDAEVVENP